MKCNFLGFSWERREEIRKKKGRLLDALSGQVKDGGRGKTYNAKDQKARAVLIVVFQRSWSSSKKRGERNILKKKKSGAS